MFTFSSFSLRTLLVLGVSVYRAATPSTDISQRGEALVPAVVFDCRVPAITDGDIDFSVCDAMAPGVINGLLEPIVFATTGMDISSRLLDDVEIAVDDAAPQGVIRQLLEPSIVETVNADVVVLAPAVTMSVDDTPKSVSVPHQPTQPSLRVARAQSLTLSAFLVVVALTVFFKKAFQSIHRRLFPSIPIPAARPWYSSLLHSSAQVSVFTMIIMVLISFVMGFLVRSVSFQQLSTVFEVLHPLFVDLYSCFRAMASCGIESAESSIVDACLGSEIRQGEVVIETIPVSEEAEHLETLVDTASRSVCGDTVEPSRTSVSIEAMPEVQELKNVSIGTDAISKTSTGVQHDLTEGSKGVSIGTDPISKTSIGIQFDSAPVESKAVLASSDSRDSLHAKAKEGNSPPQTMAAPDVFSVPAVTSFFASAPKNISMAVTKLSS
ncbi:hypothetical protein EDD18DRAFT_154472 [Armillaria luteobubalina]|uniref:Uncharacterized protein n=1 Tax=Armillaria luteobubalina TaxID=153913 RepID=A0AA39Q9K3_9AGAR|nr:hypothetical protein EDD18DRAFT_154472 [Armillaria luteobubalina]